MHYAEVIFLNNKIQIIEYNPTLKKKTTTDLLPKDLERYYDCNVRFDKSLTVEGFMTALKPFFTKIDKQFYSYTRGFKLIHYFNQMRKPAEKEENPEFNILYAEFYWHAELWSKSNFNFYASIHGITDDKNTRFGFNLSPINDWKHYCLKINPGFKCLHLKGKQKDGKIPTLFDTTREFTLHEIIRCFFYELTFHGYTEQLIERRESVDKQIEDIKSGKAKTYTMDEVKLKTYKQLLKYALKEKDEKSANKLSKKIEKLELKLKRN